VKALQRRSASDVTSARFLAAPFQSSCAFMRVLLAPWCSLTISSTSSSVRVRT
jgi:hypothetical protein